MDEEFSIGYWIKRRRKSLDLTQKDLANLVQCALITIAKIEADQRRPSRDIAQLLARHLQVPEEQHQLFVSILRGEKSSSHLRKILIHGAQALDERLPAAPSTARAPIESDELRGVTLLNRISRGRLVGRKTELARALHAWDAARSGDAQALIIRGEPGIGKSRLAQELLNEVKSQGGAVLVGNCFSAGERSYAPFSRLLQSIKGFPDSLPEIVMADLKAIAPQLETRFPHVTSQPALDPLAEKLRLFESVFHFLDYLIGDKAGTILIEDIHWADTGTLELIKSLVQRFHQAGSRVLIILTAREEIPTESYEIPSFFDELRRGHLSTSIHLDRFDLEETRALLASIFDQEITDEFIDLIFAETQGNPFFIEEVCKDLIERGDIYWAKERWERRELKEIQVPKSVEFAIQARLQKLPKETQDILLMAAVLGRRFEFDVLQAALNLKDKELIQAIEMAKRSQIILDIDHMGGGIAEFSHNLVSTVLAESASIPRRRKLHNQAVEALEKIHPDEYPALAYHCREATDHTRSASYFRKAAERAMQVYAHEDALRFYSEAISLVEENRIEACQLLLERAKVYDLRGQRALQLRDLQSAERQAEASQDIGVRAAAALAFAEYAIQVSDSKAVIEHSRRAIPLAEQANLPAIKAQAHILWGRALSESGELQEAQQQLVNAGRIAQEAGLELVGARSLINLGNVDYRLGDYDGAKEKYTRSLGPVRKLGERRIECMVINNLGNIHWAQDNLDAALGSYEQALTIARAIGDRLNEARALSNIGSILTEQYKYAEALHSLKQAVPLFEELGHRVDEYTLLGHLGDVMEALGRYDQAYQYKMQGRTITREIDDPQGGADMLAGLGRVETFRGNLRSAQEFAEQAIALAREQEYLVEEAAAWHTLGFTHVTAGNYEGAEAAYSNALAFYDTLKQARKSTEMHAELAWLAYERGDLARALEHLEGVFPARDPETLNSIRQPAVCWCCYSVLKEVDSTAAHILLSNGYFTLDAVARKIQDPDAKDHYLKRTPHHAALLEAWQSKNVS